MKTPRLDPAKPGHFAFMAPRTDYLLRIKVPDSRGTRERRLRA